MATSRPVRVAEAIRREVGDILLKDIKDSRLKNSLTSVTDVEVTKDLRYVTIYISVLGKDSNKQDVMEGLESAKGYIRSEIGKRVNLRFTPEIRFKLDESIEKASKILNLMDKIKSEESISND